MSNKILEINADKISSMTGYSIAEVAVVKNSVAKGTTDTELAYFLNVCKSVGLNPFAKEIWCYRDNQGNLLVFAGRDGFRTKAQQSPLYNGMRSSEVCSNDEFSLDIAQNKIEHKMATSDRGNIIGAYSIVFRKDGEPSIAWAEFKTYNRGFGAWKTHPSAMIIKVAETNALKAAFGIAGIQSEYEYNVTDRNVAIPIETISEPVDNVTDMKRKVFAEIKAMPKEGQAEWLDMLKEKSEAEELTYDFLKNILGELTGADKI